MNEITLDATDLALLNQLQRGANRWAVRFPAAAPALGWSVRRRVKRLRDAGLIEREIAILSVDKMAAVIGHGLVVIVEITLDHQDQAALDAFEARVVADDAVQQCYRVSPGPDFCLVVHSAHMPDYLALAQRLFTTDANVRNVKAFFSIKRSKFGARVPLPD